MKQKKDWKIEFVESDKVIDFSYELVRSVFGFESVFLSNESTLYDFDDSDSTGEQLLARVGEEYKISLIFTLLQSGGNNRLRFQIR